MACMDMQVSRVVKEGRLGKAVDKIPSKSFLKSKATYYWWVLKHGAETAQMDCYRDHNKTSPKESLRFTVDVKVEQHEHDNYISLKLGERLTFLRAETRQQRDEWHGAIQTALGLAASGNEVGRRRVGTEAAFNRSPPRRGRPPAGLQTSPSLQSTFERAVQPTRPLPPLPVVEEGEACVRDLPPYCCVRHHIVASCSQNDSSDVTYQNIHFVKSKEDWIWDVESRRQNLGKSSEAYDDLSRVVLLTTGNDLGQVRRRDQNNPLPLPRSQLNVFGQDNERTCSLESNEDNTAEGADSQAGLSRAGTERRLQVPPPLPTPEGHHLQAKIKLIKQEQKETAIIKTFPKESVLGDKVRLMELNDGIYVIGLSQAETSLRGPIKVGDQLIRINQQTLTSVIFAKETIKSTDEPKVTFMLKRIPYGLVCTIRRVEPTESLGIGLENNEITSVRPYGLASIAGDLKPQGTGVTGRLSNWAITEINTLPVDLFASTQEVQTRLDQAGLEVSLVLQPVDFIQMMRDQLKEHPSH